MEEMLLGESNITSVKSRRRHTYAQTVQVHISVDVLLVAVHLGDGERNLRLFRLHNGRQEAMDAQYLALGRLEGEALVVGGDRSIHLI